MDLEGSVKGVPPSPSHMAMGQNPVPPVNIPIRIKIGPKMGGEFTYPKMGSQNGFDQPQYVGKGVIPLCMVVVGNILHFCLLWFSGKSPLNC